MEKTTDLVIGSSLGSELSQDEAGVLAEVGLDVAPCAGTYFLLADFTSLWDGDDLAFARHLIETRGVAATFFDQTAPGALEAAIRDLARGHRDELVVDRSQRGLFP